MIDDDPKTPPTDAPIEMKIPEFFERFLGSTMTTERFHDLIVEIANQENVQEPELRKLVLNGITRLIAHVQEQRVLTSDEINRIIELDDLFCLKPEELTVAEIPQKLMMHLQLNALDEGTIAAHSNPMNAETSVVLQKDESIIWVLGVGYNEIKDHTRYVGGSQGLSIRLIKGLYYRTGAFAGHKITEQGIEFHLGDLTITNKVMFFVDFAGTTIVRIDIPKIVAMESYADGFKVVMGGAKPKPFTFMADVQDIWFASNVISRITQSA